MITNYHTHTYRCMHACGTDRDYVEAAIACGCKVLGFSDHTPWLHKYAVRMQPEEMAEYTASVLALREEYKKDITIYLGLEVEYLQPHFDGLIAFLKNYPLDYIILGHHYILDRMSMDPTDDPFVLDTYCSEVLQAMDTGVFTYLAHPDVINFQGDKAIYEDRMRKLCRAAAEKQMPLEINFHGLYTDKHYPNPFFWKIAGEEGCTAIFACDAHDPKELLESQPQLEWAQRLAEQCHLKLVDDLVLKKLS